MKEKKMLGILRKVFKDADEFEKQVFKLAFKRMGGTPADAQGVLYSKSGKRLVGAQ